MLDLHMNIRLAITASSIIFIILCCKCSRGRYESVQTPLYTEKKEKTLRFDIDSQPQGASVYIDSTLVGSTPVTVQETYVCNEVTYKKEFILKTERTGIDIGAGAVILGAGLAFGLTAGIVHLESDAQGAFITLGTGLGIAGFAFLVKGIIFKVKNGKTQFIEQNVMEECPAKEWQLILTKDNYICAEKILTVESAMKKNLVIMIPANVPMPAAPPEAALDKAALLSSMAEKSEAIAEKEETISNESRKFIKQRMDTLTSHIQQIGEGYEAACDDLYFSIDAGKTKTFEITTQKGYCYAVTAVAQPGKAIYMTVFRGQKEITKDLSGSDIANVFFCSDSSDPVRVTILCKQPANVGLRVYLLAK